MLQRFHARLIKLDPAALCDASRNLGIRAVTCLSPRLRPFHKVDQGIRLLGEASTVRCATGDVQGVLQAIRTDLPHSTCLVVQGCPHLAYAGELFTAECKRLGLSGLVVSGGVRDLSQMRTTGLPVYAAFSTPASGTNEKPGELGVALEFEEGKVEPGDIVLGDDDGVVVVDAKADRLEELITEAERLKGAEVAAYARIEAGAFLLGLYLLFCRIQSLIGCVSILCSLYRRAAVLIAQCIHTTTGIVAAIECVRGSDIQLTVTVTVPHRTGCLTIYARLEGSCSHGSFACTVCRTC